jgi:hypothetical protein
MKFYREDVLDFTLFSVLIASVFLIFFAPSPLLSLGSIWVKDGNGMVSSLRSQHESLFGNPSLYPPLRETTSQLVSETWYPFGRIVTINSTISFVNGTVLVWQDFFYVSVTYEFSFYGSTLSSETNQPSTPLGVLGD